MFREADASDALALRDLERTANLAALGHVFPPDRYPFPDDAVLARWRRTLADPAVRVLVVDDPDSAGLIAYAAFDADTLRHLAVRPDHWGRGLASSAIEAVLHLRGSSMASLWCLQENHRARALYEYLGWQVTDDRRSAPWPPHPAEVRYTRLIVASDR